MKHEKIFQLTDGCMWEINKQSGNEHPHAIEVVDTETGAIRYIKSGSRIAFIKGEITDIRTQSFYNSTKVSTRKENKLPRTSSKTRSGKDREKNKLKTKSI